MVWITASVCQVENMAIFGTNMVSFLLTYRARRWYVAGVYVPPNNGPSVHCMDQALQAAHMGLDMILLGDLNAWLGDPSDEHEKRPGNSASGPGSGQNDRSFPAQEAIPGSGQVDV